MNPPGPMVVFYFQNVHGGRARAVMRCRVHGNRREGRWMPVVEVWQRQRALWEYLDTQMCRRCTWDTWIEFEAQKVAEAHVAGSR